MLKFDIPGIKNLSLGHLFVTKVQDAFDLLLSEKKLIGTFRS